tara:strand:+ start:2086 stop:2451 length:366 start_codon:yes stop_codon:yes gene_type:complete
MKEKKEQKVKLKYDFPTQLCCEVYVPNLEDWFRVTCNVFRSWCGQRRILHIEGDDRMKLDIKHEYKDYNGPTYLFDSNKKINPNNYPQNKVAFLHDKDPRQFTPRNGSERDYIHKIKAEAI